MNNIYKSNNRVIAGVCGGLAEYFHMEVTIVRIITFVLVYIYGLGIWVYIVLWIIMPSRGGSNRGFFGIGGGSGSRGGGRGKSRR